MPSNKFILVQCFISIPEKKHLCVYAFPNQEPISNSLELGGCGEDVAYP